MISKLSNNQITPVFIKVISYYYRLLNRPAYGNPVTILFNKARNADHIKEKKRMSQRIYYSLFLLNKSSQV